LMHALGRAVRRSIRLTPMNDLDAFAWLTSGWTEVPSIMDSLTNNTVQWKTE